MIDHLSISVKNIEKSKDFYAQVLKPLNGEIKMEHGKTVNFGKVKAPFGPFWMGEGETESAVAHVAFMADSKEAVAAFYEAGLAAGGTDNGAPGYRPEYSEDYYAAFILDPDGNNIEAVYYG